MHIAIDVNDASVANKILDFLNGFKGEVKITASKEDEKFFSDRESLQNIYKNVTASQHNVKEIDDSFWDAMDKVIRNAFLAPMLCVGA